jgi:hypothetical protein
MMRRNLYASVFAGVFAIVGIGPGFGQEKADGCSGFKWSVDRELTAFSGEGVLVVNSGGQIPGIMEAVSLRLAKQDDVHFEVPPSRKPKNNPAFAGVFPIVPVAVPGPYNVTVSDDAWIDVIQNGHVLRQTGFTGSHTCAAIHKSVRFDLEKGPATVMITDAAKDALKIDVLPPPP